jgi:hypothetical protein
MDSQVLEIIVDWGLVASTTVLLGFVLNQGYTLVASFLRRFADRFPFLGGLPANLADKTKKLVTYVTAVTMTVAFADLSTIVLPGSEEPAAFISAVLVYATTIFKFAQQIYDRLWQPLRKA